MIFFYLLDLAVILFLLHQVAVPLIQGLPVFPMFREKEFRDELIELNQQVKEKDLKSKINVVKSELKGKK